MRAASFDRVLVVTLVVLLPAACGDGGTGPVSSPFVAVTTGALHSCGVTTNGAIYCWGWNRDGQLGDGTDRDRTEPVQVQAAGVTFSAVTGGGGHTCALADDGRAFCWGFNLNGQLGLGAAGGGPFNVPQPVTGDLVFTQLAAGGSFTCGVTTDQAAYCWGWNGTQQLGDGTATDRPTPVAVTGGLTVRAVTAGAFHACALTTTDEAYCWGDNDQGQLGSGSNTASSAPVVVTGGRTFTSIAGGFQHTCAVTVAGAAFCWGRGDFGQLGTGQAANWNEPRTVSGGLTFAGLALGGSFSCGVAAAAAYCWGLNTAGQLGSGAPDFCTDADSGLDLPCSLQPDPVGGSLAFTQVAAGSQHACGLTTDRIAYCWGLASNGQLGNGVSGDTEIRVDPVRVLGQP